MTTPLITDHAWRSAPQGGKQLKVDDPPCEYMNCRRPRSEHERAATRRGV